MVAVMATFMACSKDPTSDMSSQKKNVGFEVLTDNDWQPLLQNGSDNAQSMRSGGVFKLQGENPADTLFLHTIISDNTEGEGGSSSQTRAMPVDLESFYDSFGVFASVYVGSWDEGSCLPDYIYNEEVTKSSDWTTSYLWPGGGNKVRFFAYAPYNGDGIALSDVKTPGTPSMDYTVPADVNDQKDLLVAVSGEVDGDNSTAVPMTFKHVLTAVKFVSGDDMLAGSISKVTIKGVYGSGSYTMGADSWSGYGDVVDFSQDISCEMDGSADQQITPEAATFMMLPQTLPDGASIEVVYTDKLSSTQRTLTAQIAGSDWPMGEVVTYRISTTSINIVPTLVIYPPVDLSYKGGTAQVGVVSFATVSRDGDPTKKVPLSWTAECVEDNGDGTYSPIEKPEWLAQFPFEGRGSLNTVPYSFSITAQNKKITYPRNETLKNATPLGSDDNRYSLDTNGGTTPQNTANCYIVNAPGKYKFPLVFGNAIKNGQVNTEAFSSAVSGSNVLNPFICVGANGEAFIPEKITSPYIYENKYTYPDDNIPNAVEVEWQDVSNLVTNTQISEDGKWVYFDVEASNIKQGNALITVASKHNTEKGETRSALWTWHIWVTDYKLGDDLKTAGDYAFMPVNLGWCEGPTHYYEPRSVMVRFTQAETGASQVVTIEQYEYSCVDPMNPGNSPYYQWGRVCPTVPAEAATADAGDKTVYMKFRKEDGTVLDWVVPISLVLSYSSLLPDYKYPAAAIYVGLASPFGIDSNINMDGIYANLWSANCNVWNAEETKAVKTIYDPCPVGYQVPVPNAFKSLGAASGKEDNGGINYTCDNGTIFFPALGLRDVTVVDDCGVLRNVAVAGNYWTAAPYVDATQGVVFQSTSTGGKLAGSKRGYGYSMRPMRERD